MIDPGEPTDPEILAAVEAWARARGWLAKPNAATGRCTWEGKATRVGEPNHWLVSVAAEVTIYDPRTWDGIKVSPLVALAWAIAVEADERVDVGMCPACEVGWQHSKVGDLDVRKPCSQCLDVPGRDTRELARLVLDAAPREWTQAANGKRGSEALAELRRIAAERSADFVDAPEWVHAEGGQMQVRMHTFGDQASIAALTVHADRLQRDGSDLGELLALYLARWTTGAGREGSAEAVRRLWDAPGARGQFMLRVVDDATDSLRRLGLG